VAGDDKAKAAASAKIVKAAFIKFPPQFARTEFYALNLLNVLNLTQKLNLMFATRGEDNKGTIQGAE
jgi:hypothetical protein